MKKNRVPSQLPATSASPASEDDLIEDTCAEYDGYDVAKALGANHHGFLIARCSQGPTPNEKGPRRGGCWGMLRWHGPASDGAILCEGHFAEAEGEGYQPAPRTTMPNPDLGPNMHTAAIELSQQARALREEAEQLYKAAFALEMQALEGCPTDLIPDYPARLLGAIYMGYRAKRFDAVVALVDRARGNEVAFAWIKREIAPEFLAPFLRAVDHPQARVDFLARVERFARLPLDIPTPGAAPARTGEG